MPRAKIGDLKKRTGEGRRINTAIGDDPAKAPRAKRIKKITDDIWSGAIPSVEKELKRGTLPQH